MLNLFNREGVLMLNVRTLLILILTICAYPHASAAQNFLAPESRGWEQLRPLLPEFRHPPRFSPKVPEYNTYEKEDLVAEAEECLGKYQCLHKKLHTAYNEAFAKINCYCYTGRCRPSTYRTVPVSATNETGIQIFANGTWCDVPKIALRRNQNLIPTILRQFKAHVCVGASACAELECAIVNLDG